jgi:hypothetical protein
MEKLTVKIAKLVGTPDQDSWSQVHTFIPEDEEKRKKRGILLAVFSFSNGEGTEAVATGRELLSRFHEEFYGETEEKVFTCLKSAMIKIDEEFTRPERNLEIAACVIIENLAYLAVKGKGKILLKREGVFQTLVKGNEVEIETASGQVKEGDLILLGTSFLFQVLPEGRLKAALANETPDEVVEAMAPTILGQKEMARASSLVALIQGEREEAEPESIAVETEKPPVSPKFHPRDWLRRQAFLKDIKERLSQVPSKLPRGVSRLYLRQKERELRQKKMILTVAVILIVLLGVSVIFGSRSHEMNQKKQKFEAISSQIETAIQEGEALRELNPLKAKETLLQAQGLVNDLEELDVEKEKFAEIKSRFEQALATVVKEHELTEVPVYYDLSLIRDQGRGEKMALDGDQGVILDSQGKRLFGFRLSQKSIDVLAGGDELEDASLATIYSDRAYVLTEKGILEIEIESKKTNLVIERDEEWGKILGLGAFGSNLYLVDGKGMIWRYPRAETGLPAQAGFGSKQKWFGSGVAPDLSEVVSMGIDGSIWLLREDGKILKFTRGAPDTFGYSGLDKEMDRPQAIFIDEATENLYLLDRGNSRILVLAKSGEYQGQYLWPGMSQATDLVVSEAEKKILLLVNDKVYEIGIE